MKIPIDPKMRVMLQHAETLDVSEIVSDAILEAFYACRDSLTNTVSERDILAYVEKMRGEG